MEVQQQIEEMTVPEPMFAPSFVTLVAVFAECFTAPTFQTFRWLLSGWILCITDHTVTGVIRAANAVGVKHHTTFHRFFRAAAWVSDEISLQLIKLVMALLSPDQEVIVAVDDTLGRHVGPNLRGASMHHDPLLSTRTKVIHHWGHVWVVLSIVIQVPRWKKSFALPILARLYRSKKVCEAQGHTFLTKLELATEMISLLAKALPQHKFCVVGDNVYTSAPVIRNLPPTAHYLGRARMDAALYAPPPTYSGRGRPRVKGARVLSPKQRAQQEDGWESIEVTVYGRSVTLQIKLFDALWYRVSHDRMVRFALIRGWPGHKEDDVLCCTDLSLDARTIVERYCLRWSIEVTFHEVKSKLGFEDPQNRTDLAVERTAPMALWTYTLIVVWYLSLDQVAELPQYPWYEKSAPAFSDMLAALRRETWKHNILDPLPLNPKSQKSIEPLLYEAMYAA